MNISVVQNAIAELDRLLARAEEALSQIEANAFGAYPNGPPLGFFENPEAALADSLEEFHESAVVVLEAADLMQTRASFMASWLTFKKQPSGLTQTKIDHEYDYMYSVPLNHAKRLARVLRACVDKGLSSTETIELQRLEAMLEATAVLVHRRKKQPSREMELQAMMHDYLWAAFPDFVKNPRISGRLKNFDPDCGIRGVNAAVEFKIVRTRQEVAKKVSEVIEDIGGYRGSRDWTRFYSVFYQAHPFMTEREARRELERAGGTAWTPIVVNGIMRPGSRRKVKVRRSAKTQ